MNPAKILTPNLIQQTQKQVENLSLKDNLKYLKNGIKSQLMTETENLSLNEKLNWYADGLESNRTETEKNRVRNL